MSGNYVGEEDRIDLENGDQVYILRDLGQGADDDLWAFDRAQGGSGDAIWIAKLLELAIVRIAHPDGTEEKPTYEDVRLMKGSITAQLREAVMSRWYPLGWAAIKALAEETETTSGELSTGSKDSAQTPQNGSSESTSLEQCTGTWGPTGQRRSGLLKILRGLWPRRRGPSSRRSDDYQS